MGRSIMAKREGSAKGRERNFLINIHVLYVSWS